MPLTRWRMVKEEREKNGIAFFGIQADRRAHTVLYNDLKSNNVVLEKREDEWPHPVIIGFGKSVAIHKAVNPVAKPILPRALYSWRKTSVGSDVLVLD